MISLTSFHCSYPQLLQDRLDIVGPCHEIFSLAAGLDRHRSIQSSGHQTCDDFFLLLFPFFLVIFFNLLSTGPRSPCLASHSLPSTNYE
ncbi:hypothetical protein J3E68DRAFT_400263 [Trichoderma sp. SZMC 28012]